MEVSQERKLTDVALWILSWRRQPVLEQTLSSLVKSNLPDMVVSKRIYFQEISDCDLEIAARYDFDAYGSERNIGIAPAWKRMLDLTPEPYVLVVENDCPVIEKPETVWRRMQDVHKHLLSGSLEACSLRSIDNPGAKFNTCKKYCRYWGCDASVSSEITAGFRRFFRPLKARRLLGSAPFCVASPESKFSRIDRLEDGLFRVSSANWGWSNQSVIFRTQWMRDVVLPRVFSHPSSRLVGGAQDIERALNRRWWRKQNFPIGISSGFFTHLG